METLEYNHEDFGRPRAGDEKLAIRFFKKASQDMEQTREQNRPIFAETEYIQIMVPGDKTTIVVRPISYDDHQRFAKQYESWKSSHKESLDVLIGTPLETWNQLSLAQVEEFRYFGIRTVEHLAALRDDVMMKMPGAIDMKKRAQTFLDAAAAGAPLAHMQAELDKRDNEMVTLRNMLKEQGDKIEALVSKAAAH